MTQFREAKDEWEFLNLGFCGAPFTWCNNKDTKATVWAHLDKALENLNGFISFHEQRLLAYITTPWIIIH